MNEVLLPAMPALAGLYRQAALGAVLRRAGRRRPATALPEIRHRASGGPVDRERLTAFQHLVGQAARDAVPSAHVHTLAFPVAMSVMARPDFPLPMLGMVHLSNTVVQTRALRVGEEFESVAYAENLTPHRSGTSVDLVTEVSVDGQRIWTGRSVYLARGVRTPGGREADPAPSPEGSTGGGPEVDGDRRDSALPGSGDAFIPPVPTAQWHLASDTGRAYAAVSGDWNPIHLSAPSARLLGMKRAIAHGVYLAARMVEMAEPAAPEALSWGVDFLSPALLPGTLAVAVRPGEPLDGSVRRTEVTGWAPGAKRPSFTGWVTGQAVGPASP
ncbi:MaoC/PaaZ C-terminal domain-containing protein [Arthrobacter zhaoguopingii]|uniref:MaoC/PaaZ C-terminal domain-containing protein n=1 Tax=Arthrobacter zhaoguopingii TaxID=2681491 RepID=UPI00135885A3|nr:MaoC/PaaZ C-terminal domain-containing protein [Arthrobacter zhaoguopingii]